MPPSNSSQVSSTVRDDNNDNELDLLLAEAADDADLINEQKPTSMPNKSIPRLTNDNSFADAFASTSTESSNLLLSESVNPELSINTSELKEELDSSDDEEVKNFLERKYNEYGRDINKKLKNDKAEKKEKEIAREVHVNIATDNVYSLFAKNKPRKGAVDSEVPQKNQPSRKTQAKLSRSFKAVVNTEITSNSMSAVNSTIFTDPIFGLRIINPLISSAVLMERMKGRKPISVSGLKHHIENGDLTKDWVVAGSILHKSPVKTTKTGGSFSIWKLTDLKGDMKTFSIFLFKGAHKELWKTAVGMFVAVLNPGVFEHREERDSVATLTVDSSQKIMVLGQSKDMGTCKAKKNNGENCTMVVNLAECDFCVYHVKNAFIQMSQRSELQSSTAGRGLQELRNKVLGKSEVFYAGQSFAAVPAKKSAKLTSKDNNRMTTLSEYFNSPNAGSVNHSASPKTSASDIPYAKRAGFKTKVACKIETNTQQRLKDIERLKILKEEEEKFNLTAVPAAAAISIPQKFQNREFSFAVSQTPKLNRDTFSMDLSFNSKKAAFAKEKAARILKMKPIEKSNPNLIKYRGTSDGKKRVMEELNEFYSNDAKRRKMADECKEYERKSRLQKIIDATSSHKDLIEMREMDEQQKYFNKLEKKEAMEEKMLKTYEIACKAVTCLQCKYTSFSASDHCKTAGHPLKVVDAEKRFFKCLDCGNRTASLLKLPKTTCNTCKSSRWERAGMIRDRKLLDPKASLSIRGDEETFIGSSKTSVSLNLLVPDDQ